MSDRKPESFSYSTVGLNNGPDSHGSDTRYMRLRVGDLVRLLRDTPMVELAISESHTSQWKPDEKNTLIRAGTVLRIIKKELHDWSTPKYVLLDSHHRSFNLEFEIVSAPQDSLRDPKNYKLKFLKDQDHFDLDISAFEVLDFPAEANTEPV